MHKLQKWKTEKANLLWKLHVKCNIRMQMKKIYSNLHTPGELIGVIRVSFQIKIRHNSSKTFLTVQIRYLKNLNSSTLLANLSQISDRADKKSLHNTETDCVPFSYSHTRVRTVLIWIYSIKYLIENLQFNALRKFFSSAFSSESFLCFHSKKERERKFMALQCTQTNQRPALCDLYLFHCKQLKSNGWLFRIALTFIFQDIFTWTEWKIRVLVNMRNCSHFNFRLFPHYSSINNRCAESEREKSGIYELI